MKMKNLCVTFESNKETKRFKMSALQVHFCGLSLHGYSNGKDKEKAKMAAKMASKVRSGTIQRLRNYIIEKRLVKFRPIPRLLL